jgi:hypothetical protein
MTVRVENYTWDYGTDQEIPGVKIVSNRNRVNRYLFLADEDIYGVALELANIIEEKRK